MRELKRRGLELIKSFEGVEDGDPSTVNLDAYVDPVGIYTIGWGHAVRYGGGFLTTRTPDARTIARQLYPGGLTREQAEALLRADVRAFALQVENLVRVKLSDNQFAALVSFHFNTGALGKSTLLAKLNLGDYAGASLEFGKWTKGRVGGRLQVLPGLVRRRAAEAELFKTP